MIKAVAIDVDGTLTEKNRQLNLKTVEKVRELERKEIPVILATGNILCMAEDISILVGTTGPIIAENGGIIKDSYTGKIQKMVDLNEIEGSFEYLSSKLNVRKVYRSEYRFTEVAIYRDFPVEEIRKILKAFNVEVVDTKYALHIKSPQINKGTAIVEVAKIMGLSLGEIAALGDSENDREMMEKAGYSISIGEESLVDVSDWITPVPYGEGGYMALKKIMDSVNNTD